MTVRFVRPARGAETAARIVELAALANRRKLRVNRDGTLPPAAERAIEKDLGLSTAAAVWIVELALAGGLVVPREGRLRAEPLLGLGLAGILARAHAGFVAGAPWVDDLDLDADAVPPGRHLPLDAVEAARPVLFGLLARLGPDWAPVDDLVDAALAIDPALGFRDGPVGAAPDRPTTRLLQREFARGAYVQAAWRLGLVDVGSVSGAPWTPTLPDARYDARFREEDVARPAHPELPRWTPPPCDLRVRLTPLGRRILRGDADATAIVGPVTGFHVTTNFEVVAPVADTPPDLLFRLDFAARALVTDPASPVRRWRFERERWLGALQGGLDGAALLGEMAAAFGRPLPENVAATVEGWAGGYGVATVFSGHDLVAYADRAARDADAHAGVAVGDRWLLVPRGRVAGTVVEHGRRLGEGLG